MENKMIKPVTFSVDRIATPNSNNAVDVYTIYNSIENLQKEVFPTVKTSVPDLYMRRNMVRNIFRNRVCFVLQNCINNLNFSFKQLTGIDARFWLDDIIYSPVYYYIVDLQGYTLGLITISNISDIALSIATDMYNRMCNIVDNNIVTKNKEIVDMEYSILVTEVTLVCAKFKADIESALEACLEESKIYSNAGAANEKYDSICCSNIKNIDMTAPINGQKRDIQYHY